MTDVLPSDLPPPDEHLATDERKLVDIVNSLCSVSTAEIRHITSLQLRAVVDSLVPITDSLDFSSDSDFGIHRHHALTALNNRLLSLLSSPQQQHRLAAIAAFTALIHTESETETNRALRGAAAVRHLYDAPLTDIRTAKAASVLVSTLADLHSPIAIAAVDEVLSNAINTIASSASIGNATFDARSADRAKAAMVITELASVEKAPKFVLRFQHNLRIHLWHVIWDRQPSVREQGVHGLQAILETVILRASKQTACEAMDDVLRILRRSLLSNTHPDSDVSTDSLLISHDELPVIHGSLRMLMSLISSHLSLPFLKQISSEIRLVSLEFQTHSDALVRHAVSEILPHVVPLDDAIFSGDFIRKVSESTTKLLSSDDIPSDEKGRCLLSLATLWSEMVPSSDHLDILESILGICRSALHSDAHSSAISSDVVLKTVSALAVACKGIFLFETTMREGLLMRMFSTKFTSLLVSTVNAVRLAVPSLDEFIRGCLINLIAATLKKGLPDKSTGMSARNETHEGPSIPLSSNNSGNAVPVSGGDMEGGDDEKRVATAIAGPINFFKQYPFSTELHNVDNNLSLASSSSSSPLDGLVSSDSSTHSRIPVYGSTLPMHDVEPLSDKHDSPCVALRAIVNSDFRYMKAADFTSFVSEYVIGYVESNSMKTRALAVAASAKLMDSAANVWVASKKANGSGRRIQLEIQALLAQLVMVAVADPSKDVRYVGVNALDRKVFHPYLLQPEVLKTLFMSFHDESLAIRGASLSLVGRLGNCNPAYILPALRSYLAHLLNVLRLDGEHFAKQRQEATELINTLVRSARYFVEPYTSVLVKAAISRLEESREPHESILPVLHMIAEMGGLVSRLDLSPYREQLLPIIVSTILEAQGVEPAFMIAGLQALSSLVQNTGSVIKPYVEHPTLLPRLLELLRVETHSEIRLHVGNLLGSLGAVDPDNFKYAALPMPSGGSQLSHIRGNGSELNSSSVLKTSNDMPRVSGGGTSGRSLQSHRVIRSKAPNTTKEPEDKRLQSADRGVPGLSSFRDSNEPVLRTSSPSSPKPDDPQTSLLWFKFGGAQFERLVSDYTPEWRRDDFGFLPLVGQLDHPFTASQDYFPSVLLDELHKLISVRRPLYHVREACQAIVNILRAVGPRCTRFLPEVVPRMLWFIEHLASPESSRLPSVATHVKPFVIQKLGEIVTVAGHNFTPYTFDTLFLLWQHLRMVKNISPNAVVAFCSLLTRIRLAIGDEFKPVIATILPQLFSIIDEDSTSSGHVTSAALATIESLGPLLEDFSVTVLSRLTLLVNARRPLATRKEALTSLIRVVQNLDLVTVLPSVIHPLIRILAGVSFHADEKDDSVHSSPPSSRSESNLRNEDDLGILSGAALIEIGTRCPRGFNVFVPVIAKALKQSSVRSNLHLYMALRGFLTASSHRGVREVLGEDDSFRNLQNHFSGSHTSYDGMSFGALLKTLVPNRRGSLFDSRSKPPEHSIFESRIPVAEETLVQKWEVESHFVQDDWVKWMSNLGAAMFQYSGCSSFRACIRVSEAYPIFTKSLFNAAFLACWTSPLSQTSKSKICSSLDLAISSSTIPLNVLQALLNLFEYMDHDEKPLPVPTEKLASTACRVGALAKAIRYREQSYSQHIGRSELLLKEISGDDGLIAIYEKLGHTESAVGILRHYEGQTGAHVQELWYEKLQRWDDALAVYKTNVNCPSQANGMSPKPRSWDSTLGMLRCLNQVGEWRRMVDLLHEARDEFGWRSDCMEQLAIEGKALSVTFDLGLWDEFRDWLQFVRPKTYEECFYNAVFLIKVGRENPDVLDKAQSYIHEARGHLDLELTARVSEGYPRAYSHVVKAQTLSELEEMVSFLRAPVEDTNLFARRRLLDSWDERLGGCKRDRLTWYRLLMTRSLVLKPIDNKEQWLEYATMCRKAKLLPMASEALHCLVSSYLGNVIGSDPFGKERFRPFGNMSGCQFAFSEPKSLLALRDSEIKFACIKHLWALERRTEAYRALEHCRNEFLESAGVDFVDSNFNILHDVPLCDKRRVIPGEVFLKLSKWGHRLRDDDVDAAISATDPLEYARKATEVRPTWYKAWHYWAVMNGTRFEALVDKRGGMNEVNNKLSNPVDLNHILSQEVERRFLIHTVQGYFKAIDLQGGKSRLEDSLKVLTLWFRYGRYAKLHVEFNKGFDKTNIARWLEVVPQIIARLHSPYDVVQKGVKSLLTRIGMAHPHVAVYPLTVAKSAGGSQGKRSLAAREILDELKTRHKEIVEQAEMVARELVRVAVLWTEQWYEKLEEASKIYFVEHDVAGMIDTLLPLHEEVEAPPKTDYEKSFIAEFGEELSKAAHCCRKYLAEQNRGASEESLNHYICEAWNVYTHVFRKIQRHQQSMHELNLRYVSKELSDANGLQLAVPGTYDPEDSSNVVGIHAFNLKLHVMQSKQRPRRLCIIGDNGQEYHFLLKGHEDLRQDERVMQVFGLINKLFSKSDRRTLLQNVEMKRYSVIALSASAGLIEWVPDCDTMHALVKNYREVRKIVANIEQRVMLRCAPEPERLTLLQKVDIFEYMLQSTAGADLSRVLWLKSRNSEMWLDRRTTYARSLATTSMTGYLLGLGDRHPSNLMIERSTGKIMHIDFGDCFEVAMKREKYPERVPFRLTRMLVDVLEPCGVEGYFQHTSEATLEVLRQKNGKESMMSMMEAFVYDPLIRWKLIGAEELTQLRQEEETEVRNYGEHERNEKLDSRERSVSQIGEEEDNDDFGGKDVGAEEVEGLDGSMLGLGRDVARDIDEIVRSLPVTGSLRMSVRQHDAEQRRLAMAGGSEAVGVYAGQENEEDMVSPSYETRMRQERALRGSLASHEKIARMSNERAQAALDRFEAKLMGSDFSGMGTLSVPKQERTPKVKPLTMLVKIDGSLHTQSTLDTMIFPVGVFHIRHVITRFSSRSKLIFRKVRTEPRCLTASSPGHTYGSG